MSNENFYKEINLMFEGYLSAKKDKLQIRIKDKSKGRILTDDDMNYSRVFFDSNLNIFKRIREESSELELVQNDNFEAVIVKID